MRTVTTDPRMPDVSGVINALTDSLVTVNANASGVGRTGDDGDDVEQLFCPAIRAFLAMGSNVGDRRAFFIEAIRSTPGAVRVSGCYETEPIGGPSGQDPYLNVVVEVLTRLDPFALLAHCHRLERAASRMRAVRNGPRTLDVDVLLYADVKMESGELTIPHPRMVERRFVLTPLSDLSPRALPEGLGSAPATCHGRARRGSDDHSVRPFEIMGHQPGAGQHRRLRFFSLVHPRRWELARIEGSVATITSASSRPVDRHKPLAVILADHPHSAHADVDIGQPHRANLDGAQGARHHRQIRFARIPVRVQIREEH